MVKLHELISKYDIDDIVSEVVRCYPEQEEVAEGYSLVAGMLKEMKYATDNGEYKIEINKEIDEEYGDYFNVVGVKDADEMAYALEFEPWETWMAAQITDSCFELCSQLEVVAHCLYEMTFAGFDQKEIRRQLDIILEAAEEVMGEGDEDQ